MPTLTGASTVTFPIQVDQTITLSTLGGTGRVTLASQKSGEIVYSYTGQSLTNAPIFSPGSQGVVTITHLTGRLTYDVTTSAYPLFENTPRVLAQNAIPFILAGGTATNQFTINATGALSNLSTLPITSGFGFFYMPAITGLGNAGWYYGQILTATTAQLYTATYLTGDPKLAVPTVLTTPTGVTAGNNSQSLATITTYQLTVPANSMGPNGSLRTWNYSIYTTVTTQSVFQASFGGSLYLSQGQGANSPNIGQTGVQQTISNNNSASRQLASYLDLTNINNVPGSLISFSVNTANDVPLTATLALGNLSSVSILFMYRFELMYGA